MDCETSPGSSRSPRQGAPRPECRSFCPRAPAQEGARCGKLGKATLVKRRGEGGRERRGAGTGARDYFSGRKRILGKNAEECGDSVRRALIGGFVPAMRHSDMHTLGWEGGHPSPRPQCVRAGAAPQPLWAAATAPSRAPGPGRQPSPPESFCYNVSSHCLRAVLRKASPTQSCQMRLALYPAQSRKIPTSRCKLEMLRRLVALLKRIDFTEYVRLGTISEIIESKP